MIRRVRRLGVVLLLLAASLSFPAGPAQARGCCLAFILKGPIKSTPNAAGGCNITWPKVFATEQGKSGIYQIIVKGQLFPENDPVLPYQGTGWRRSLSFPDDSQSYTVAFGPWLIVEPGGGRYDLKITVKGIRGGAIDSVESRRYKDVGCGEGTWFGA